MQEFFVGKVPGTGSEVNEPFFWLSGQGVLFVARVLGQGVSGRRVFYARSKSKEQRVKKSFLECLTELQGIQEARSKVRG